MELDLRVEPEIFAVVAAPPPHLPSLPTACPHPTGDSLSLKEPLSVEGDSA